MKSQIIIVFLGTLYLHFTDGYHVVCYYDSRSIHHKGPGKMTPDDLEPILGRCTHLVYGYAKIDSANQIASSDKSVDLKSGMNHYHVITSLKEKYPHLKVLLSVGGEVDLEDKSKYKKILLEADDRSDFVRSVRKYLMEHHFDGLDLFWHFPDKEKDLSILDSLWQGIKAIFGYTEEYKARQQREGFTNMVKDLKKTIQADKLILTATFLPQGNRTIYIDPEPLARYLDQIHIRAFDFTNPERNPKMADYPAALQVATPRDPLQSARGQVMWWLKHKVPKSKIVLGIPTFGRTWGLGPECGVFGEPPTAASGPAEGGPYTQSPGFLSYSEICLLTQMPVPKNQALLVVPDPLRQHGTYAFRPFRDSTVGIWVGYTDPDTAVIKTEYVKNNTLGGVAFWDVSLDDFRGTCTGTRYPIIQASVDNLQRESSE